MRVVLEKYGIIITGTCSKVVMLTRASRVDIKIVIVKGLKQILPDYQPQPSRKEPIVINYDRESIERSCHNLSIYAPAHGKETKCKSWIAR